MTRIGKIARLPRNIRETLNTRLDNGEPFDDILLWLNSLSEVRFILASHFEDRPVSQQNLTAWKAGGFRDWQRAQHLSDGVDRLLETAGDLDSTVDQRQLVNSLATILAAELAFVTREFLNSTSDPAIRLRFLGDAIRQLSILRQSDRFAVRAGLERLRLEVQTLRRDEQEAKKAKRRPGEDATLPDSAMSGSANEALIFADFLKQFEEALQDPHNVNPSSETCAA